MNSRNIIRKVTKHVTTANLIASLALFVALSGVGYAAAKLPAKSVGAKQIKSSAVTSAKIKNRTVTASDVKPNTLTGTQINEEALASVPRAASADRAASASNQAIAYAVTPSTASDDNPNYARTAAKEIPLESHGAISIYAKCFTDADNKRTYFETYARTSAPGSVLIGYSVDDAHLSNPAFDPGTDETDNQVSSTYALENTSSYTYAETVTAVAPDGKGLTFDVLSWARNGTQAAATKTLPEGNSCAFQLTGLKVG